MTKNILLMAAIVATSFLFLKNNEAQGQGWRIYHQGSGQRGATTRNDRNSSNRGFGNTRRSQNFQTFRPYNNYSTQLRSHRQYGYPSSFGNRNYVNNSVYRYPYGYQNPYGYHYGNQFNVGNNFGIGNNYGYRSNVYSYGYQPRAGIRVGSGNTGFHNNVWRFLY